MIWINSPGQLSEHEKGSGHDWDHRAQSVNAPSASRRQCPCRAAGNRLRRVGRQQSSGARALGLPGKAW